MNKIQIKSSNIFILHFVNSIWKKIDTQSIENDIDVIEASFLIESLVKDTKFNLKKPSVLIDMAFKPYLIYFYDIFGFHSLLLANHAEEEFIQAFEKVANGAHYIHTSLIRKLYDKKIKSNYANIALLTPTEQDVIRHIFANKSNAEIADLQKSSIRTIENHKYKIFRKLEIRNAAELIQLVVDYAPWLRGV